MIPARRHQATTASTLLLFCFFITIVHASFLGFGVDRVKGFRGHGKTHLVHEGDEGIESSNPAINEDRLYIEEHYYAGAVIDNFAPVEDQRYWQGGQGQRYFTNNKFWGGDGFPIFVMIGGEGPESKKTVSKHLYYYELARKHRALMVAVEHRFYGRSYPFPDMSTSNMRFLNSPQALADLARLIDFIRHKLDAPDSQIVTFGGSYPGNLAAWFRQKYPHLTIGSVASSAPLQAVDDFYLYMDVVTDALVYFGGYKCRQAMAEAVSAVAEKIAAEEFGTLKDDFKLCEDIASPKDLWVLETNLMGNIQGTVQYNREQEDAITVSNICEVLTGTEGDPKASIYDRFVELNDKFLSQSKQECMEVSWKKTLDEMRNKTFDGHASSRQWYYQTCTAFGYYQTSVSSQQPFKPFSTITLQSYHDVCEEIFGVDLPPAIDFTNNYYGSLGIDGSNIIFPNGDLDPWHALGVKNETDLMSPFENPVYIRGTAHCFDMHGPSPSDPPELTFARQQIAKYVAKWIWESTRPHSSPHIQQWSDLAYRSTEEPPPSSSSSFTSMDMEEEEYSPRSFFLLYTILGFVAGIAVVTAMAFLHRLQEGRQRRSDGRRRPHLDLHEPLLEEETF